MKQLRSFLCLGLLIVSMNVTAADVAVKVIALFTDKALLQVDGEQKIVSKGETFSGVLLQSASGRGAVVVIGGITKESAPDCFTAGADSVVAISAVLGSDTVKEAIQDFG